MVFMLVLISFMVVEVYVGKVQCLLGVRDFFVERNFDQLLGKGYCVMEVYEFLDGWGFVVDFEVIEQIEFYGVDIIDFCMIVRCVQFYKFCGFCF